MVYEQVGHKGRPFGKKIHGVRTSGTDIHVRGWHGLFFLVEGKLSKILPMRGIVKFVKIFSREMTDYTIANPYSEKFSRKKTFTNFVVLEPPVKVFSTKFGCAIPTYDRS